MPKFNAQTENLNVVLVGSFNPAIFHPEWFLRQGIISDADLEKAVVEGVSPEISRCQFSGMSLEVLQDHLTLQTRDVSRQPILQDVILAILEKLPHTPIRACGLNSAHHYDLGDEAYWHKIGHALAPKNIWNDLLLKPGMESLTIKGSREGEFSGHVNITVQPSKRFKFGLFIGSNTHYGSSDRDPLLIEKVKDFISSQWEEAYQMASKTAAMVFERIQKDE